MTALPDRLQDQLDEITANRRRLVQADRMAVGERAVRELFESGIEQKILPVGATAPEFALNGEQGRGSQGAAGASAGRGGDPSWRLVLPATYVLTRDRRVVYAQAHADFHVRPEPEEATAVLAAHLS